MLIRSFVVEVYEWYCSHNLQDPLRVIPQICSFHVLCRVLTGNPQLSGSIPMELAKLNDSLNTLWAILYQSLCTCIFLPSTNWRFTSEGWKLWLSCSSKYSIVYQFCVILNTWTYHHLSGIYTAMRSMDPFFLRFQFSRICRPCKLGLTSR